jgi:DNA polymerase III alpha subunit
MFPQLRVRTEFSYRQCFGPVAHVAKVLAAMQCPAAAIVDGGTWGHVRWAKELGKTTVKPLFGTELAIPQPDGRKPTAWALARDSRAFYRFSTAARREGVDLPALFAASAGGVLRFAGAALDDPECFDFVDINPGSALQTRKALALAKRTGKPLVITSDNAYAEKGDYSAFMALIDREKTTPQHILTLDELRASLSMLDDATFNEAVANTRAVAEECASALVKAPLITLPGDLRGMAEAGRQYRVAAGHIPEWTQEYDDRLQRELAMIESKKYESYFLMVADLVCWAKDRMLVGPGRGSSAGSIACYLLRITEIDSIKHDLLFERFIDVSRNDLPDIDIDFNDQKRDTVFTYLADKYGSANVARIGNINTMKPRSVMAQVCKKLGIPDHERFDVLNVLIEYSSGDSRYGKGLEDTMANTEPGKRFAARHQNAHVMFRLENHASHSGVHAAGVIVCNEPVSDFCTVGADGVAHIDKPDAEYLNLLKIDALGLRTLGVIEDAGVATSEELYGLPLDDQAVLDIFNEHRYSGVFQFEGQAQRRVAAEVNIDSFRKIDHVTALARPGPLGGGASQHYIARAAGREEVTYRHPTMADYLSKTMGVVLYQEQVMRICFEIGRFSWEVVSEIRKAMSGRKGKEYFDRRGDEFVKGAATIGVPESDARTMWNEICTFGAWGMNASHTTSYGVISYWCAWMKRYHPLEYAAASLRGAKDDDQTMEILRDMAAEGIDYIPFDAELSAANWSVTEGKLLGGFMNLVGIGPAKAAAALELREQARRLPDGMKLAAWEKTRAKLATLEVKFSDLYPLHNKYRAIYNDPEAFGCAAGSVVSTLDAMPNRGSVLLICKIINKKLRDRNEAVLVARRNGRVEKGQTLFLDIIVNDDSGTPCTLRIDKYDYEPLGRMCDERLQPGDELLVRGVRVENFSMVKVDRIKCLSRPEAMRNEA